MKTDKQFYVSGNWAIASDGIQWILQKKNKQHWKAKVFIRTDREILERCMRELHVPKENATRLILSVPQTFEQWWATQVPADENNRCRAG